MYMEKCGVVNIQIGSKLTQIRPILFLIGHCYVSYRTHSSILVPKSYYTHISLNFYYLGILFARHVDVTMTIVISIIRKNYESKNRTNVSPTKA